MAGQLSSKGTPHHSLLPTYHGAISLLLTADLTLRLLSKPYIPAPNYHAFQGTCMLVQGTKAVARIGCVVFIPFRLTHICCSLSKRLTFFSSVPNNCPDIGIWLLLQFPAEG